MDRKPHPLAPRRAFGTLSRHLHVPFEFTILFALTHFPLRERAARWSDNEGWERGKCVTPLPIKLVDTSAMPSPPRGESKRGEYALLQHR